MTRKQAIKWLKTFRGRYGMNELEDAVDMAIKALEAPPNDNLEGYSKRLWKNAYERGKADAVKELADIRLIVENEFKQLKEQVSAVFDKYKAEGEGV